MASIISHPAVPLALAPLLPQELRSPSMIFLGVVCSMLPDLDVVGFRFGVPYGHLLGHRGLSHSMAFAVFLSACLTWLLPIEAQASRMMLFGFLFLSTVSHGILDALTSGGLGVALFAPFENSRYFFPWRPIRVSPMSVSAFLSATGVRVLRSELQWIWLPATLVAVLLTLLRRSGQKPWRRHVLEVLRQATADAAQAEACFQQAVAIARHQQAKSWELRAGMSLRRLRQPQGKRAEARELLVSTDGWFTQGFDTADLQEVKAVLEAFS